MHSRTIRTIITGATTLALVASSTAASSKESPPDIETTIDISAPIGGDEAVLHLFAWPWDSIASECTNVLGPAGFGAVEVSAPQEHVVLPEAGYPWWQDYQPVSYELNSRRGSAEDFAAMVAACDAAGVDVYVDAVINHMTGQDAPGVGSGGSPYEHYDYPDVPYTGEDFHHCGRNGTDDIVDWTDVWEVQNCELLNLADLATEKASVRQRITDYLGGMVELGVDGFRVDAAKHMPAADLAAIYAGLPSHVKIFQEVIEGGPGEVDPLEYVELGRVTEFRYGDHVGGRFKDGQLVALQGFQDQMLLSSSDAMTFIDNHDTQRNGRAALTYKDGARYFMAEAFMMAHPYGTPHVLSGYEFDDHDAGPPSEADGTTTQAVTGDGSCATGWECSHRRRTVLNMAQFRSAVGEAPLSHWWSNGSDQIAFGREGAGFVAFNATGTALTREFATGLPAGTYCDVLAGDAADGSCTGPTYTVDGSGTLSATVPANGALAIHIGAMTGDPGEPEDCPGGVDVVFTATATTEFGQEVHAVGSIPALGSWDPALGVRLGTDEASYPRWTAPAVTLPVGTVVAYKYVKRAGDATTWESGDNRSLTVAATPGCQTTVNDTWR
ncbi:carbohydrate-binding module family 20 domain-containing protein [Stackebrandtia soli]|uniref:carbohydrate-binding module family 20 domain-containing protein n=1 Tax=Stackebrandtia soli TaxID=1892856 RepID=UPI0039E79926